MVAYVLRKILFHGCLCVVICTILNWFSRGGQLYAGFGAAFLGAVYLLQAWLRFLRAGGTDLLRLLRRKQDTQVPYFLQRDKEKKPGVWPGRHKFPYEDSLEEEEEDRLDSQLPRKKHLQGDAIAFALCGIVCLLASLLI